MIEADFDPQVNSLEKVAVWYAFWAEAQANPSYRERVSRLEARYFEETRSLFQRLIEEGGYAGISADAVTYGINAMIDGFAFDLMIDPASYDREEAKRICRLFLSGLFPRDFSGAPQPASAAAVTEVAADRMAAIETARQDIVHRFIVAPGLRAGCDGQSEDSTQNLVAQYKVVPKRGQRVQRGQRDQRPGKGEMNRLEEFRENFVLRAKIRKGNTAQIREREAQRRGQAPAQQGSGDD